MKASSIIGYILQYGGKFWSRPL